MVHCLVKKLDGKITRLYGINCSTVAIENLPCYMLNIYIPYNKVTCPNA